MRGSVGAEALRPAEETTAESTFDRSGAVAALFLCLLVVGLESVPAMLQLELPCSDPDGFSFLFGCMSILLRLPKPAPSSIIAVPETEAEGEHDELPGRDSSAGDLSLKEDSILL